ncbi:hypothetical protein AnigIFM59636_010113 [Aspergillus niger]|uniref:Contig An08c0280, genomic contig n=3 Tax=Aspergillus niger TaxID=5061 RepID=A2QSK1_ASPNC|nr:uncharacterized protein BO96DRAFT_474680 [Aspergillus niger CBS 101883]XP_059604192.1 uncharacterized protein An08g11010 [Aspergillus niger]RDH16239.1 hypothetical protein M747DRAFT_325680 [Aspergillus niger ATCC 13496]PYH56556.1 hypothetical protein BO96DRAFT_474680 [Aspergillus niger CBS 101883]TPR02705.1 hypothetical protein CAN33_0045640 [Aspergillus niger]CAK45773.1 unnamed protein product [Aspergillus niger]GJP97023.1 uncharacterized protein AlacWU_09922 [Aspergillus niger]
MAPLIRNISRQEVQWVNSSSSCTYNKICFFRRTGFVVYLADHATIIGHFLIISASNRPIYTGFPDARINTSNLLSSFAFGMCACILPLGVLSLLLIFDSFWPERKETRCIQWTWKLGAAAASLSQLAACIVITLIVATQGIQIHGVSADEEAAIRGNWNWISLAYGKDGRTVAGLVFYWIGCVFMFWSTIAMWHCYAYHNIHWPFANHARQRRSHGAKTVLRSSVILNSSELAEPRGN